MSKKRTTESMDLTGNDTGGILAAVIPESEGISAEDAKKVSDAADSAKERKRRDLGPIILQVKETPTSAYEDYCDSKTFPDADAAEKHVIDMGITGTYRVIRVVRGPFLMASETVTRIVRKEVE